MKQFGLTKAEKLCSKTIIEKMFVDGTGVIGYPLRAVYTVVPDCNDLPRFYISVPKRKQRKAVSRVLLRRRVREAYRLHKEELIASLAERGISVNVAFIYLSEDIYDYHTIEQAMLTLFRKLVRKIDAQLTISTTIEAPITEKTEMPKA